MAIGGVDHKLVEIEQEKDIGVVNYSRLTFEAHQEYI